MSIPVTCGSCHASFNAPDSSAGKKAKCPKCAGIIEIPLATSEDDVVEAEEAPVPSASNAVEGRKPCPMCGELIQQDAVKCRHCGEVFDPLLRAYGKTTARKGDAVGGAEPLFLYVPVSRLVVLSIVSLNLYEAYWIYKNWKYVKQRDNLNIWPFMRGMFGIFFCNSLLKRIHEDPEARAVVEPTFSPSSLATGWVILMIIGNLISRSPSAIGFFIAAFIPSFLCLVPVQKYINAVTERRSPSLPYYRWSSGHIVCLVFGIIIWGLNLLALVAELAER